MLKYVVYCTTCVIFVSHICHTTINQKTKNFAMIPFTFKYVLRNTAKGIYIQADYSINRKRNRVSTGIKITEKDWNQKGQCVRNSHLEATKLNQELEAFKNQISIPVSQARISGSKTVKNYIEKQDENLFEFVQDWIEEVATKRGAGTMKNYLKFLRKLKRFVDPKLPDDNTVIDAAIPALTFDEVDDKFLKKYEDFIRGKGVEKRKENSTYILSVWKVLKTWFNAAIKKGYTTNYPFHRYENPIGNAEQKDVLTMEELFRWEAVIPKLKPDHKQAAIYFLLGCYSGLRVSDWRNFNPKLHIKGNRLLIRPEKTKNKTGAWVTLILNEHLIRVVELIKKHPLTIKDPTINEYLKIIAIKAKVNKYVTTHVGRNTFAVTICAENGISCEACAKLMGITIKICEDHYYRATGTKIDYEVQKAWVKLESYKLAS